MKYVRILNLLILLLPVCGSALAQEAKSREELFKDVSKEMVKGVPIELKALEIRAKIYEPQIIYVLDRAKIDVDIQDEKVTFLPRIAEPILDNTF
jgi:hypothetical protein